MYLVIMWFKAPSQKDSGFVDENGGLTQFKTLFFFMSYCIEISIKALQNKQIIVHVIRFLLNTVMLINQHILGFLHRAHWPSAVFSKIFYLDIFQHVFEHMAVFSRCLWFLWQSNIDQAWGPCFPGRVSDRVILIRLEVPAILAESLTE